MVKTCECGKQISLTSIHCRSCARKGERNPRFKGGCIREDGYKIIVIDGKRMFEHRHIWEKYYGEIPKEHHIHHIDNNPSNNEISNLKLLTNREHRAFYHKKNNGGLIRTCIDCGLKQPINDFPKRKESRTGIKTLISGHRGRCKDCLRKKTKEAMRKWRAKHEQRNNINQ